MKIYHTLFIIKNDLKFLEIRNIDLVEITPAEGEK